MSRKTLTSFTARALVLLYSSQRSSCGDSLVHRFYWREVLHIASATPTSERFGNPAMIVRCLLFGLGYGASSVQDCQRISKYVIPSARRSRITWICVSYFWSFCASFLSAWINSASRCWIRSLRDKRRRSVIPTSFLSVVFCSTS